jgi:hypothetical protein
MIETSSETQETSPLQAFIWAAWITYRLNNVLKELDAEFGTNHDNVQQATEEA